MTHTLTSTRAFIVTVTVLVTVMAVTVLVTVMTMTVSVPTSVQIWVYTDKQGDDPGGKGGASVRGVPM